MHTQALIRGFQTPGMRIWNKVCATIEARQAALAVSLLVLNLVDALFTLRHVDRGAMELNPLMAELLGSGCQRFILIKHALVSLGLVGILLRGHSRLARLALPALVALFSIIAIYHGALWIGTE